MDLQEMKKEEKKSLQKNYELHRWYRQKSELDSGRITRIGLTAVISLGLGVSGYYILASVLNAPIIATFIGIGIFFGGLTVNQDIRSHLFKNQNGPILKMHENARYYILEGKDDIIFIETDAEITALGILEFKRIPLMLESNLNKFMRVMYKREIPLFCMITLAALDDAEVMNSLPISEASNDESGSMNEPSQSVVDARVLLGTFRTFKKRLERSKIQDKVSSNLSLVGTTFRAMYPHSKLVYLHGRELYQAFNLVMTSGGAPA